MNHNQRLILQALRFENISSREIARGTGISQATVSRNLQDLPVIKLGNARSSVFAAITPNQAWSLYEVDEDGQTIKLGRLYNQPSDRRVLVLDSGQHTSYDGLPYFLYDALPAGFLGAIRLKKIMQQDQTLSSKSQDWSDLQVLHYLTNYGDDLAGNLLLSSNMAHQAAAVQYSKTSQVEYASLTREIQTHPDNFGSSIAGEQPKFTIFNGQQHLIVKYSPVLSELNSVAQRHRDLMICEHLALESLRRVEIPAANSSLFFDDRVYLEIQRFDRKGQHGRKGIVSLKSLDAEFVGNGTEWPVVAKVLLSDKRITTQDYLIVETAFAFGKYIANSDMHLGNFSFFMDGLDVGQPTPIYDMLPMAYMPKQGELINPELDVPRFVDVSNLAKHTAIKAAIDFWQKVMAHPRISEDFKMLTEPFYENLKNLGQ